MAKPMPPTRSLRSKADGMGFAMPPPYVLSLGASPVPVEGRMACQGAEGIKPLSTNKTFSIIKNTLIFSIHGLNFFLNFNEYHDDHRTGDSK
jgi:hypothetical protein